MNEQDYNKALDLWEAKLAADYLDQASRLTGDITMTQILAMIKAGDDWRVVQTLESATTYGAMLETMRSAYIAGGTSELDGLSGAAFGRIGLATGRWPEFDPRRQTAEAWLQNNARGTLNGLMQQQGEAVQLMLAAGREREATPRQIAEMIVGKMQVTGRRAGGVVGLAGNDAQAIVNARAQLESGDPALMRDYFQRVRRDKRFDKTIAKAIAAGQKPPQDVIDKAVSRYSERLLQTRAEAEASIHAMEVYNAGRAQLYRQLVEDGIDPNTITKQWRTRGDEKVRISHKIMSGQTQKADVPFNGPSGIRAMNPGDRSLGAPVSFVARCRCRAVYTITPATSE